ncbi:hypothetical protein GCM10023319_20080 [Nocardia iowensis]
MKSVPRQNEPKAYVAHKGRKPTMRCPRCRDLYDLPARSRVTRGRGIKICGDCGANEAAREAAGLPPIQRADWPISDEHQAVAEGRAELYVW